MKKLITLALLLITSQVLSDARTDDLETRFKALRDPLYTYRQVLTPVPFPVINNVVLHFKNVFLNHPNHTLVENRMAAMESLDATNYTAYLAEKTVEANLKTEISDLKASAINYINNTSKPEAEKRIFRALIKNMGR